MKKRYVKYFSMITTAFVLAGCFNNKAEYIAFQPSYNDVKIDCKSGFNINGSSWHYSQFQLYISNVMVKTKKADWQPLVLNKTDKQHDNIALIGENCHEKNTAQNSDGIADKQMTNWQISFQRPADFSKIKYIKFTIGVPFSVNHLNPLTQESPLNMASMFWGWQMGHKFVRLEMKSDKDDWLFHLGSTGCMSPSALRAPKAECQYPNRVEVTLPFNEDEKNIQIDLYSLFKGVKLGREHSCQSSPTDENCTALMNNIGINKRNSIFKAFANE